MNLIPAAGSLNQLNAKKGRTRDDPRSAFEAIKLSNAWFLERKRTPILKIRVRIWSECGDLNSGPLGPEPSALPSALHPVLFDSFDIILFADGVVK